MNWALLQNSLFVSALATALAVLLGLCAAVSIVGLGARWQRAAVASSVVALMLPPFLVTNCWLHFLGHTGVWRSWLALNIFSLSGATWILGLMLWPVTMLLVWSAWQRMDPALLEVDPKLKGFNLIRALLLPMAGTALTQAKVITFVVALTNFAVPAILQVKVFPAELWVSFNTTFNYAEAFKLCWPLIVVPVLLMVVLRRRQFSWEMPARKVSAARMASQLGPVIPFLCRPVFVLTLLLSVGLPLGQIVLSKQTWTDFIPALTAGQSALWHSIFFSAGNAILVLFAALLTARVRSLSLLWLAYFVPGVLLGIALIWIFNRPPLTAFYQSAGIVFVAFAVRYFAPAFTVVRQALGTSDRQLSDAAMIEGANAWQVFRHAQLPQILPQLGVAWYLTYLLCLWDVETLVLIVPPGRETISLRVFNLLHYGHNSQVNALCLVLLLLAIVPFLLALVVRPRLSRIFPAFTALSMLVFLSGCSDSNGRNADRRVPVQSRFFSHVEVIGVRGTGAGEFNKPRSLTLDRDDNLFVVDLTGRVQKFSPDGHFLLSWQMPQTDLGRPKGMGVDNDGNVIVIEPHYSRVNHFTSDGALRKQWGVHGTNKGQIAFPRSVALNSHGEMYLSEYTVSERVQRFTSGADFLGTFGQPGSGAGEFNRAEGVAIGRNDEVHVADSCNHRIQVFSREGKFLRTYGKAGTGPGELSYPYDLRVDSEGFQFICEFGNSRIQVFDADDKPVETIGEAGAAPGQFANPWSLAFDSKGNLYVADSQNHRVQKFLRK